MTTQALITDNQTVYDLMIQNNTLYELVIQIQPLWNQRNKLSKKGTTKLTLLMLAFQQKGVISIIFRVEVELQQEMETIVA